MPSELEDLVEFLHHGNTQIRQVAVGTLVGYSNDASIFKKPQMLPVKDLLMLVRDFEPIVKNVLTILINISHDQEILQYLAKDDQLMEDCLRKITDLKDSTADEVAMLLANLAKDNSTARLINKTRAIPKSISISKNVLDQLMDCFVKGADGKANPNANFDYLSYFFADMSKHKAAREYFITRQEYDNVVPITKLTVFTEHTSTVRRKGVASTIKNVAFETDSHPMLLDEDGANLLPYLLLPLAGNEEFSEEDSADMLPDLQLLPPDKQRDPDNEILVIHLETLLLLTTSRHGRELMREVKVYPFIRECHLHVENEDVREACDRLVQVLMRDEEGEDNGPPKIEELGEEDDDDTKVEEIF